MKSMRLNLNYFWLLFIFLITAAVFAGNRKDDKKNNQINKSNSAYSTAGEGTGKVGDSYRMFINNLNIPLNSKGIIAAVNIPDDDPNISGAGGKFAGNIFLFSGGFFLSGYANGTLFANAVASASLVEDYTPGTVADGAADKRAQLYVVKKSDEPFTSQSWLDWIDAVDLGADFYDGDGDGVYNPIDKNGNAKWDEDEDRPDLIGDETAWCVYNDGFAQSTRRWNTIAPLGIEVRQSVFAFASSGAIGNILFIRYRFKYVGLNKPSEPDQLDDVYFGVWADPDIGNADDDLVGSDIVRNVGYTYNQGADDVYGSQPPSFFIDFFSGPISYVAGETYTDNNTNGIYDDGVDTPLDTAYSLRGQIKGIQVYPGAKNLGISSFVQYRNGDATLTDPDNATQARNYMLGNDLNGKPIDPCTFSYGKVNGIPCTGVDNRFWYSGDPVTNVGWINTVAADVRQMQNIGPFVLQKNVEKEIVVAYIAQKGSNAIDAVTQARKIDDGAQTIFDNNFLAPAPPPAPEVSVSTNDQFIELQWDTPDQVNYTNKTKTYDLRFKGYNVYAYKTSINEATVNNLPNETLLASFQLKDLINDLYSQNGATGGIELLYKASDNQLDKNIYADPSTGRIRLRITKDPFTGGDLIKGKPYYFAVTSYAINYDALEYKLNPDTAGVFGDYYLSSNTFVQVSENVKTVMTVKLGEDLYDPPLTLAETNHIAGGSSGEIKIDPVVKQNLTGENYKVTFKVDSSTALYSAFWSLENTTTGAKLVDSSKTYVFDPEVISVTPTEGFIVKIDTVSPQLGNLQFETQEQWYNPDKTQFFYVASDIAQSKKISSLSGLNSLYNSYIKADQLRRVEIRFGESGKAFRYVNGFKGSALTKRNSYAYAEAVSVADTTVNGAIGKFGEGFVDVPFTVWISDDETANGGFGEKRQLAVGFIEKSKGLKGNPDGEWNPGTSIDESGEYILIFNSTYDPNGNIPILKGGFADGQNTVWADLRGGNNYKIPAGAGVSEADLKIAASPYLNSLYVAGIEKKENSNFSSGDKFVIPVTSYPYTPLDVYEFKSSAGGALTDDDKKSLFDKVNVFPNPLYGYNVATSYTNSAADDPFVTFSNLPDEITIKIYSLSGQLLRTLTSADKSSPSSPFLQWNLQNETGLRVASGVYLAIITSPKFGDKILKFSIIMPQKQIQRY